MLRADLVPASHDAALQQGERGLNRVSSDASAILVTHVLFRHVVDGFVRGFSNSLLVGWQRVGNDHVNIGAHVFTDVLRERAGLRILSMEESEITITLSDSDYDCFVRGGFPASGVALFPADVGFVHFDGTVKHGLIYFFHGRTDAVAEIPRGLIRAFMLTPDRALQLHSTHALPRFAEQQRCKEPLLERQVGVIENRAGGHGELVIAALAVEELLRGCQFDGWHLAARALHATGPAETDKKLAAFFVGVEQVNNVN